MRVLSALLVWGAALLLGLIAPAQGGKLKEMDCDKPCTMGSCNYENCVNGPACPGGLCTFTNCVDPSCGGGVCTFIDSYNPTCNGGLCKIENPQTVLKDGYCRGTKCTVNGKAWPHRFSDTLSE
eukprot:CAMPEP_0118854972 /NCGR_PEP_ID=MMETSP1163-20130328/2960_1 /TAXON_ID=124430 /ORGANISM="Phaeomonas parva, Strain CCMP2877" /LENGTH=123 /DNA_ID=CAMNT_0006787775 /DNA_START=81 /DNA_END=452 /DNA_ORIENTATION=-